MLFTKDLKRQVFGNSSSRTILADVIVVGVSSKGEKAQTPTANRPAPDSQVFRKKPIVSGPTPQPHF
jgi:hypothetical protein